MELRDYQIAAIRKMKTGCILNGGVGSGKSLTSLGYFHLLNGGKIFNHDEFTKMVDPMDLYIITTARKRDCKEWEKELSVYLMSPNPEINVYKNKIVVDSWNNIQKYVDVEDAFFIFDEDRVTGSGAWVKAFLKITRANDWIILSATPGDNWMDYVPVFIANGFYKNKTEFCREHVQFDRRYNFPKIDRYFGTRKLERLRESLLIDMDFKRETEHIESRILCNYNKFDYQTIYKDRWDVFNDQPIENAASMCYALRRVCASSDDRQVKLLEILDKTPKAIIFYNFDYELDILKKVLEPIPFLEIAEWNGHKHQEIPTGDKWVYLVQYTAGAEGWNCITTDTIIFYSQNYSYKIMEQAKGRIDRLNTPYTNLYYYELTSSAPIELAIKRALADKKKFNERSFCGKEF